MEQSAHSSRPDAIHDDLARRIVQGEFPPGTRLPPERRLAESYDTNRNTLREAVRRLEHARLVSVRQGSGVTVRNWRAEATLDSLGLLVRHTRDPHERATVLMDLLIGRMAVLEHAVALAAERRTDAQLSRIEAIIGEQISAYHARDRDALMAGDMALVESLVEAANSITARWIANSFVDVYRQLASGARALWLFHPGFPDYLDGLRDALQRRDDERAKSLTRAYYAQSDEMVIRALRAMTSRGPNPSQPVTANAE